MIERLMMWVGANRTPCLVVAGLAAAFGAGWWGARATAKPAVALKQDTAVAVAATVNAETTREQGPTTTTIDETLYDPPTSSLPTDPQECHPVKLIPVPMPGPVRVVRHTVIETGPETTRTVVAEHLQEQETQHVSLTVTPAARPGWAVSVGMEDVLGARPIRLALRRHLFGPFAVEVSAVPFRRELGAAVAMEF